LSERIDERLVVELAAGKTYADAASAAGVSVRTVERRMANPAFRQRVLDGRSVRAEVIAARLLEAAEQATLVLSRLLRAKSPTVRLGAAKVALSASLVWRSGADFEMRLQRVEEALERGPMGLRPVP